MVAEQDFARIRSTLAGALGLMLLLNVPATIGLIVLARPIVAVIFEHGEFTASDTIGDRRGAAVLRASAWSATRSSASSRRRSTRIGRSRIPVMVSAASVLVNVALNLALVRVARLSRPRARHVDHRHRQRRGAAAGCCAARFTASKARASPRRSRASSIASAVMGAVTWGAHAAADRRGCRARRWRCRSCGCSSTHCASRWRRLPARRRCCASRSSARRATSCSGGSEGWSVEGSRLARPAHLDLENRVDARRRRRLHQHLRAAAAAADPAA